MCQLLILTRNSGTDKALRENLEQLGFETLCSTEILEELLADRENAIFKAIPTLFLSVSIADNTVVELLEKAVVCSKKVFRVDFSEFTDQRLLDFQSSSKLTFVSENASLKDLREMLGDRLTNSSNEDERQQLAIKSKENQLLLDIAENFSELENKLFYFIAQKHGEYVQRLELANYLWTGEITSSRLAQLSQLVNKVRMKLKKYDFPYKIIETHWRKGYRITPEVFDWLDLEPEKKRSGQ